ncbi:MAG: hypothetical protein H8E68_00105 [Kiritimatiellaeota bacterium]|nr:hypothetical protein [Kiritimatiellota bacterium]
MGLREDLQKAIDEVKAKGIKNIQVENLENWLFENGAEPSQVVLQTRELVHQSNLAKYHADVEFDLEEFRAVLRISEFIIRWLIIVSGSACVALLALIGNLWIRNDADEYILILLRSLRLFGGATIVGLLSAGSFYFTQYYSRYCDGERPWKTWRSITIGLVLVAIGCLGWGAFNLSFDMAAKLGGATEGGDQMFNLDFGDVTTGTVSGVAAGLVLSFFAWIYSRCTIKQRQIEADRERLMNWRVFIIQHGLIFDSSNDPYTNPIQYLKNQFDKKQRPYKYEVLRKEFPLDKMISKDSGI